jgi:hypothetical protein
MIDEREPAGNVLLDHDHRQPPRVDLGERLVEPVDHDRRQSQRALIEQDELRRSHQRAADGEHLLLAAGQLGARVAHVLPQGVKQFVHLAKATFAFGLVGAVRPPRSRFSSTLRSPKIRRPSMRFEQ